MTQACDAALLLQHHGARLTLRLVPHLLPARPLSRATAASAGSPLSSSPIRWSGFSDDLLRYPSRIDAMGEGINANLVHKLRDDGDQDATSSSCLCRRHRPSHCRPSPHRPHTISELPLFDFTLQNIDHVHVLFFRVHVQMYSMSRDQKCFFHPRSSPARSCSRFNSDSSLCTCCRRLFSFACSSASSSSFARRDWWCESFRKSMYFWS